MVSEAVREHGCGWSEGSVWESVRSILTEGDFPGADVDPGGVWTNDYLDMGDEHLSAYAEQVESTW
jgi:hypothetical protein